ncbi:hypothetical protein AB6A23_02835 [Paenibacillus tarimensis]
MIVLSIEQIIKQLGIPKERFSQWAAEHLHEKVEKGKEPNILNFKEELQERQLIE